MRKGVESVIPAGIVSVRHLATIFRSEGVFSRDTGLIILTGVLE
jgi:hypothetical protein